MKRSGPAKCRVVLRPGAIDDLRAICAFIAERSPQNAVMLSEVVLDKVESLATLPQAFPVAPESVAFGFAIRQLSVKGLRVLFCVEGRTVRVLHIRAAKRDFWAPD